MGISAETLKIWEEIEAKVEKKIFAMMSRTPDAAEDVVSEVKILFLTGNSGDGYNASQAYSYATTSLYKTALRECNVVTPRVCVGSVGAYTDALRELGDNPDQDEVLEVEDMYHPQVSFSSYEVLVEDGWDQEAREVDPLNNSGIDERICAFLANTKIDPMAKVMALQILDGDAVRDVARRHGVAISTVNRLLRAEAQKLPQEHRYVINNVTLKPQAETSLVAEEAEIVLTVSEVAETTEIPAETLVMAKVISEAITSRGEASALVISLAEWRNRLAAMAPRPPGLLYTNQLEEPLRRTGT